jgi:hypothetical protein
MKNIAGELGILATKQVIEELLLAKITNIVKEEEDESEVNSSVYGIIEIGGVTVTFKRAWYYWVVKSSKPLLEKTANELNVLHKEVVRVSGFAGGYDINMEKNKIGYPDNWHVDTQKGLEALVQAIYHDFLPETYRKLFDASNIKVTDNLASKLYEFNIVQKCKYKEIIHSFEIESPCTDLPMYPCIGRIRCTYSDNGDTIQVLPKCFPSPRYKGMHFYDVLIQLFSTYFQYVEKVSELDSANQI